MSFWFLKALGSLRFLNRWKLSELFKLDLLMAVILFKNMLNWSFFPPLIGVPVFGSTSKTMLCASGFGLSPSTIRLYRGSASKKCGIVATTGASANELELLIRPLKSFEYHCSPVHWLKSKAPLSKHPRLSTKAPAILLTQKHSSSSLRKFSLVEYLNASIPR